MHWVLFAIFLKGDMYYVVPNGVYPTMDSCFEARESLLKGAEKPKVNYQVFCVKTDQVKGQA